MNILIIGNGFDLAHQLLTRYTDFLEWVQSIEKIAERLEWVERIPKDKKDAIEKNLVSNIDVSSLISSSCIFRCK